MTLTRPGAAARAYSSLKMTCSVMVAPAAPVLDRPAQAGPAASRQHLLPAPAHLEAEGLVARAPAAPELGEFPHQVLLQEVADLPAERHVLGAVAQIHRRGA